MNENIDIEPRIEDGAVKVYQNDMTDDFPVLKAFQQYIDAEQAKARKRIILLCIFFSFVLVSVIAVFVGLLLASSSRNQVLNDRLVEYAMKDRDRVPVVTQPTKDDSAVRAISDRLEALQRSLIEERERYEKAAEKRASEAAEKVKRPSAESIEIDRLKALLAAEKAKAETEREKLRQAELEAYRRKHYPEFYGLKPNVTLPTESTSSSQRQQKLSAAEKEADREIEEIINDVTPIEYFDEEESEEDVEEVKKPKATPKKRPVSKKKDVAPSKDDVAVPQGVQVSSGMTWNISEE